MSNMVSRDASASKKENNDICKEFTDIAIFMVVYLG